LGPIAAEQVLSGKYYNRGMRAHKITSQALWRLLLPPLLGFLKDSDREIYDEIIAIKTDHVSEPFLTLVRINLIILGIRLFYNKVSCSKFLQDFSK
jgi:hypothetical protein